MTLDPGAANMVAASRASGRPPVEQMEVSAAREAIRAAAPLIGGPLLELAEIEEIEIDGPGGALAIRIYRPQPRTEAPEAPALLFLHGGGWVLGDFETHEALVRQIAKGSGCIMVAVDYRLAPEHPFPAAIDDAAAAFTWLVTNAARLGVDPHRIGVAGDSAGGNLAAVLAIMARDGAIAPVAAQILLYPVCDLSMSYPSYVENGDDYLLTRDAMAYFIDCYSGGRDLGSDWRGSPLEASDLGGVAPAFVLTSGYDPLRDEGDAYAARLSAAGVPTEHIRLPGQIHGFLTAGAIVTEATEAFDRICRAIGTRFEIAAAQS